MAEQNGKTPPVQHVEVVDVPLLPISAKFLARPIEDQCHYWHKLASSSNSALARMQQERDAALSDREIYKNLALGADQNVEQQRQIVVDTLTQHAENEQEMADRIKELQAELKEFETLKRLLKRLLK